MCYQISLCISIYLLSYITSHGLLQRLTPAANTIQAHGSFLNIPRGNGTLSSCTNITLPYFCVLCLSYTCRWVLKASCPWRSVWEVQEVPNTAPSFSLSGMYPDGWLGWSEGWTLSKYSVGVTTTAHAVAAGCGLPSEPENQERCKP